MWMVGQEDEVHAVTTLVGVDSLPHLPRVGGKEKGGNE